MAATRVTAAHITPACRLNHGTEGAFNEAVNRLRQEYLAICSGWENQKQQPTLNLVLTIDRPS